MNVSTKAALTVAVTAILTLGMASGVGATQKQQQPKKSHGITETAAAKQYVLWPSIGRG